MMIGMMLQSAAPDDTIYGLRYAAARPRREPPDRRVQRDTGDLALFGVLATALQSRWANVPSRPDAQNSPPARRAVGVAGVDLYDAKKHALGSVSAWIPSQPMAEGLRGLFRLGLDHGLTAWECWAVMVLLFVGA